MSSLSDTVTEWRGCVVIFRWGGTFPECLGLPES
jgi:hypothetical protein